jgi:serine/threonine-protein kinase
VDFADTLIPLSALAYMSPEQVRGEAVDFRTDIFSFGVVLYEMLSGHHPFEARNSLSRISAILEAEPPVLASKHAAIPPQVEFMLSRMLAKNREARYPSMSELLEQLENIREKASPQNLRPEPPAGIRRLFASMFGRKH